MKRSRKTDFERLYALGTGYQASEIIFTAQRLGVFAALDRGPVSGKSLAGKLKLSQDAVCRFMRVLKSMGLITERGGVFRTATGENCEDVLTHLETLKSSWQHLVYSMKKGSMHAPEEQVLADYPRRLKRFLSAMHASGVIKSFAILRTLPLQRYRSMLDIGGGMGTYAVAFAQKNPALQAIVLDLAAVVPYAKKYIRQCGMAGRVSVKAGECLSDPFPAEKYDLVLLSNILHSYAPVDARAIIKKTAGALHRGGTLLIHDYIAGCGDQVFVSLFDMTMLVGTPQGRCHSRDDLCRWLKAAGLSRIRTAPVNAGTSIVRGIRE